MQKSRLPLLILLLVLACVLCLCAAVTGFAVLQVLRSVTDVDLPQMQAIAPPFGDLDAPDADLAPDATRLPLASRTGAGVNRIVVQGADGNLYTIRPDGTDRVSLTEDGAGLRVYRQPTWSPDAGRIAWVEITGSEQGLSSALVTSAGDGSTTRADTADRPPFYLAWSPDAERLAALSAWDAGLALRGVDVAAGGSQASLLTQGQPLYFAWAPDGGRMLTHLNDEKVSLLSADGNETELDPAAAPFGAPDWLADGAAFVYAQNAAGGRKLVLADPSGVTLRDLADLDGSVSFSVSPDGRRVAYIDTGEMAPTAAFGALAIASLEGGAAGARRQDRVSGGGRPPCGRSARFAQPHAPVGSPESLAPVEGMGRRARLRAQPVPPKRHLSDRLSAFLRPVRAQHDAVGAGRQRIRLCGRLGGRTARRVGAGRCGRLPSATHRRRGLRGLVAPVR